MIYYIISYIITSHHIIYHIVSHHTIYHHIVLYIISYRMMIWYIILYIIISYWLDNKSRQFSIDGVFIIASFSDPNHQEILLSMLKMVVYTWSGYILHICCLVRIYTLDQRPKSYFRLRQNSSFVLHGVDSKFWKFFNISCSRKLLYGSPLFLKVWHHNHVTNYRRCWGRNDNGAF